MLQVIAPIVARLTTPILEHLDVLVAARLRGDLAAADAAERAALAALLAVLRAHAHRVVVRELINRRMRDVQKQAEEEAGAIGLPEDLGAGVVDVLRRHPHLPWDIAVAEIARDACPDDDG